MTNEQLNVFVNKIISQLVSFYTSSYWFWIMVFSPSFKNVLPNSNLLARKFTFHNTTFTVHVEAVTFEVTSLIVTSDLNEIRLALASSEKKVVFVTLFRIGFFWFRVNSASNKKKLSNLRHGYFTRFELHDKHSKQLYANFGLATCEIKQSSSAILGPFCDRKLCLFISK